MLPSTFRFKIDGARKFVHTATVKGDKVVVSWNEAYRLKEGGKYQEPLWDSTKRSTVERWIADGGWIIIKEKAREKLVVEILDNEKKPRSLTAINERVAVLVAESKAISDKLTKLQKEIAAVVG